MVTARDHYESLLAEHYSWMHGDFEARCRSGAAWFQGRDLRASCAGALALDLGAGAGCHSLALADCGFRVRAIDFSPRLVAELRGRARSPAAPVEAVVADLTDFTAWGEEAPELVACMGDTLTHLASREEVCAVFRETRRRLTPGGRIALGYRDLGAPLAGLDRFIAVRSDADRILTCYLEYGDESVEVHDLVYTRGDDGWTLRKSSYPKLRLSREWTVASLRTAGFEVEHAAVERGMTEIVARAGSSSRASLSAR